MTNKKNKPKDEAQTLQLLPVCPMCITRMTPMRANVGSGVQYGWLCRCNGKLRDKFIKPKED